ncbi:MAG: phosphatase PAP2 family protein [Bacteroidetes bacterium]|nr:phosphatase PAP2 family protein [Bacteroidota bacterium]MBS1973658.1 phosphatase PAP2 family protein [Bacteroidota bacterium]
MKKQFFFFLVIAASIVIAPACKKNVEDRTANLPALAPGNLDMGAGAWKPVLITGPGAFAVAAPAATNSPSYIADLNEIKGYQKNLSSTDRAKIKYWSAGGVLRWNEILRGLVAKYNLAPYQNPDGSFPAPNPNNPFAYPLFPFANPPYAARAYAYVSAAQYDALVACWYYKQMYNQAAPYKTDSSVAAIGIEKTTLPSYPSEAAVMAGVTAEMMKLLFPGEIANIQQRAQEQELAAIQSGATTRSAVTAGEALGRWVAQQFIARGKTDNAGKAGGTPTDWTNFENVTISIGQIPWYSLESPKRPPMLPFFNRVKPFLFDASAVPSFRPGPPPSSGNGDIKKDAEDVYGKIKNPTRENIAITEFWADGTGTYGPPGHWDAIAAEDFVKQNYSEVRWARNMALLNMTLMDAAIVCWDIKYYYFNPRPAQIMPAIKTLTGVPNFPSYVSGHSTFSGSAAAILSHILPQNANAYNAMAQEASRSRYVSGIHYLVDCQVGLQVGAKVGGYAVQRALADGAEQ